MRCDIGIGVLISKELEDGPLPFLVQRGLMLPIDARGSGRVTKLLWAEVAKNLARCERVIILLVAKMAK
jgi:hypothetical protein